jgi:hypothetical protein
MKFLEQTGYKGKGCKGSDADGNHRWRPSRRWTAQEGSLLNANQFVFRARHSTTLQCIRLTQHVTLNLNNNLSTAAVFLDIEKAFDTKWHAGLLYRLSKFKSSSSLIKLLSSFLSQRNFITSVNGEMSTPREMEAGVPQGSVLPPTLYNMYTNDVPPNIWCLPSPLCRRHLSVRDRSKREFCFQKISARSQLNGDLFWELDIKINKDKTQGIYFSLCSRLPEFHLILNGRNIPFVSSIKYLGVIFDKKVTWRLHIEMIEAKACRTFVRIYSLFKSERF